MLYLNSQHLQAIEIGWQPILAAISSTVKTIAAGDFAQPKKPYLRFRDLSNRIIAMPAYVGGDVFLAGLKWIASFPGNREQGLARAHSITLLNDASTGRLLAAINTAKASEIRTAAVSGAIAQAYFDRGQAARKLVVGIVGLGPIGRTHLDMLEAVFGDRLAEIRVFDLLGAKVHDLPERRHTPIVACERWQDVYEPADLFITATVARERYIDRQPKPGSLHLNVSLRDYMPHCARSFDVIAVDNWEEVCRENTDIEAMHLETGLRPSDVLDITDIFVGDAFAKVPVNATVMFNPMGMAAFDIAVGGLFLNQARCQNIGIDLPD